MKSKITKPTVLILAAGLGSRYGGLKQIDTIGDNGETIIDYSIYDAIEAGFGKAVFIIRKSFEQDFKKIVTSKFCKRIPIEYAYQELDLLPEGYKCPKDRLKPWGTGHAIWCARDLIDEPFAMVNGDDFYGRDSLTLMADYLATVDPNTSSFSMVGYKLRNTLSDNGSVARGICHTENHKLSKIVERTSIVKQGDGAVVNLANGETISLTGDETVSLNLFGFTPIVFEYLQRQFTAFLDTDLTKLKSEFFIPSVVDNLLQEKAASVQVLKSKSRWFGVTYKEDKQKVQDSIKSLIHQGEYPQRLWGC